MALPLRLPAAPPWPAPQPLFPKPRLVKDKADDHFARRRKGMGEPECGVERVTGQVLRNSHPRTKGLHFTDEVFGLKGFAD